MEAYSAPVGYVFSLNSGGRSGTFDVVAGDFSAELAIDSLNGIYVGLADNPTATNKVAKRRYTGVISTDWFGTFADGVSDDRDTLSTIDSRDEPYDLAAGTYKISSDLKLTSRVFAKNGAVLKPDSGVKLTIAGFFHPPEYGYGWDNSVGVVTLEIIKITVPSAEYPTIQSAVDACPKRLISPYVIELENGTYAEDVKIEGIHAGQVEPDASSGLEGARLYIRGKSYIPRDPLVRVKSIYCSGCSGGSGNPTISRLTIYDKNPYTNEKAALEFYGCANVSAGNLSFNGNGVQKCINVYASTLGESTGNDFGDGVNEHAYVTKHMGTALIRNEDLGYGGSYGTLTRAAYWLQEGSMIVDDIGLLTGGTLGIIRQAGTGLSTIIDQKRNRLITASESNDAGRSTFETYFESLDGYNVSTVGAGSGFVYNSSKIANLVTGNESGNSVKVELIRNPRISGIKATQRLQISVDDLVSIGNGELYLVLGSLSAKYAGFKVEADGKLYGVTDEGSGEVKVLLSENLDNFPATLTLAQYKDVTDFYVDSSFSGRISVSSPPFETNSTRMLNMALTTNENAAKTIPIHSVRIDV
jgi:hypothetical protein